MALLSNQDLVSTGVQHRFPDGLGVALAVMGNEFGVLLLSDVDESFHGLFGALVGSQGRRSINDKGNEVFFYKNEGMVVKGGV